MPPDQLPPTHPCPSVLSLPRWRRTTRLCRGTRPRTRCATCTSCSTHSCRTLAGAWTTRLWWRCGGGGGEEGLLALKRGRSRRALTGRTLGLKAGPSCEHCICAIFRVRTPHIVAYTYCWTCMCPSPQMLGPGGLPVKGQMVPEAKVWQPPEAVKVRGQGAGWLYRDKAGGTSARMRATLLAAASSAQV